MNNYVTISGRHVGFGFPVYIVAELSANHSQNFDQAVQLIKTAKTAGANAIKLQTFTPDTLTIPSNSEFFRIGGGTPWDGRTFYDLYQETNMPWEWQPKLKTIANELSMDLFSSAFDPSAVEFLEKMNVPVHKVASFEIVDIPLIERMAQTKKPLIISTGMATTEEIKEAVQAAQRAGAKQIALLKCTSAYPALPEDMNLRAIPHLAETFNVPVGLSDHTLEAAVPIAAVALGACIVEKHLTLSRSIQGPDSTFSLEPHEFKALVDSIRVVEKSLGAANCGISRSEEKSRIFRRSLFAVNDIKAGEVFTEDNVRSVRPANGLPPRHLKELLGRRAAKDIEKGTPLNWELIK